MKELNSNVELSKGKGEKVPYESPQLKVIKLFADQVLGGSCFGSVVDCGGSKDLS
ncbi:hypothetical protein LDFHOB_11945 [Candidatus Electronema aureum]